MTLRDLSRYLLRNIRIRIPAGPNQGARWSLATAGRGYGTGTFEPHRVEAIAALLRPGECFWDVGAHKGYVTLLAARRVGPTGRVYAFEPSAANLWYLRRHLHWNRVENADVIPAAISGFDGTARFGGGSSLAFRLQQGSERVAVRSIRSLLDAGECVPPTFLKIDAEGAEADILTGAGPYLEAPGLMILLSVHSPDLYAVCSSLLRDRGYRLIESGALSAARHTDWQDAFTRGSRGDPDLLAIRPERSVTDRELERFIDPESSAPSGTEWAISQGQKK